LEYERCELRPALMKGDTALIDVALNKIEIALQEHGGRSVVGGVGDVGGAATTDSSLLTAADVAITLTLFLHNHHRSSSSLVLSPAIQAYVDNHTKHSTIYAQAKALAKSLVPPPPLDISDPSLLKASSAIFASAILSVFPMALSTLGGGMEIKAFKCKDIKHGDYQCNIAMPLYQKLKASGIPLPCGVNSPQQVAQVIIDAIKSQDEQTNPVLCDLSVNGPGFIMSRIKASYLSKGVNCIIKENAPTMPKMCTTTTVASSTTTANDNVVVVDFSSPNIAKEMHVGHLRSTIIGESVCRILEYTGSKVMRINHVGDWGTQFGMLIQYLKEEYPDFHAAGGDSASENNNNMPNITDLTVFYKNAKSRFDESPDFKKISQLNVVKLQAGDPECLRIWQVLCDISRREFEKVYNRLDITVTECGESFYNDKIPKVIDEFVDRGMISVEEGGAKCVFVPKFKVPLMLQKSDGGYGYDSTDMAAIKYRLHDLKASHLVYITDFTQVSFLF
jgi:arginyl-tRNA synthetase